MGGIDKDRDEDNLRLFESELMIIDLLFPIKDLKLSGWYRIQ